MSQETGPLTIIAGSFLISLAVSSLSGSREKKFQTQIGIHARVAYAVTMIFSVLLPGWIWMMTAFASAPFFLIARIFLIEAKDRSFLKTAGFAVGILRRNNVLLDLFVMEQIVWAVFLLLFNKTTRRCQAGAPVVLICSLMRCATKGKSGF